MDYPRVTEVLRPFTSYDQVPKQTLERAAARGTTVHVLCAGIAKGNWIPEGMIGSEHIGYVNSFKKWMEAQVSKFVIIEKRFGGEELGYTGQMDMVVVGSDDELYLVDLKTSARPQKTYPVQMAAYNQLLRHNNIHVKAALLVYLNKDGEFPDIEIIHDMDQELHIFNSALDCWYYFNKRKKNASIESKSNDDSK